MKRTLIALVIATAVLGTTVFAVARSTDQRVAGVRANHAATYSLRHASRNLPLICDYRKRGYLACLNRQLTNLYAYSHQFRDCTVAIPVTQYGDAAGTFGYVYDPGTGVTFKTTSLDYTVDPTTESFVYFSTLKQKCIKS
jgi:hypothetical protein